MFWSVWLPLCIVAFLIIGPKLNRKLGVWIANQGGPLFWVFLVAAVTFVGLVINTVFAPLAKTVYPDLKNPIYLTPIPGNQDNKYLISTEDLIHGEKYTLYFLNSETGIPEQITFDHSQVRIVYDNPPRPFSAKILYTCKAKRFWLLHCTNPSPYLYELHLPTDPILK